MYLIAEGLVTLGKDKGPGRLVLTDSSIYAVRSRAGGALTGGAVGGLVGALIGMLIDKKRAQKDPPEYLNEPELSYMSEKDRKSLLTTALLTKIPIGSSLSVRRTLLGFELVSATQTVVFKGKIHQKKVATFLEQRGIAVAK